MKKFTLIVCAAMLAATSFAQTSKHQNISLGKSSFLQQMRQARPTAMQTGKEVRLQDVSKSISAKAMRTPEAPTGTEEGIIDQPEGKLYEHEVMNINGICYNWLYGWYGLENDVADVSIVEGNDGNLYIMGLQTALYGDDYYWLKAEPQGNDLYTIKMQPASAYEDYSGGLHTYYVARMEYYYDEETEYDGYSIAENPDITVWYKDGVLKTLDEMNPAAGEVADHCIGTVYWYEAEEDDDYESGWYSNNEYYWSIATEPLTETYNCPPEDAPVEDMVINYKDVDQTLSKMIKVAFADNDVYLRLYTDVPGWVKGTIEGDKVKVANGQYAGIDSYYGGHNWIHTATVETLYYEDTENPDDSYYYDMGTIIDGMEFDYDADTKTMTSQQAIYFDGAKDRIYYADYYNQPTIKFFEEVAAVPADPKINNFWDYEDYYGSAEFDFTMPTTDVEGNYINKEKLSYCIFVDDELFEADADEYEMEESMTEFPAGFRSPYGDIAATYFCIFFQPAKNMGIQAIYRGADVENRSNIVMYDIETGETYTVKEEDNTGIKDVNGETMTDHRYAGATYDLTGRRVNNEYKGLVIRQGKKIMQ